VSTPVIGGEGLKWWSLVCCHRRKEDESRQELSKRRARRAKKKEVFSTCLNPRRQKGGVDIVRGRRREMPQPLPEKKKAGTMALSGPGKEMV